MKNTHQASSFQEFIEEDCALEIAMTGHIFQQ